MDIKPIRTKANYQAALTDIESLMAAKANTPEGDRLDVLTTLVEMCIRDRSSALTASSFVGACFWRSVPHVRLS